jgi:hypothetical protein
MVCAKNIIITIAAFTDETINTFECEFISEPRFIGTVTFIALRSMLSLMGR